MTENDANSAYHPGSRNLSPRQFTLRTLLLVPAVLAVYFALARDRSTQVWIIPVFVTLLGVVGGLVLARWGMSVFWGTVWSSALTGLVLRAIDVAVAVYSAPESGFVRSGDSVVFIAVALFGSALFAGVLGTLPGWVLTSLAHHDGKMFWFRERPRDEATNHPCIDNAESGRTA